MGNNNSSAITINLDRNNLVYFTDEIISGNVNLNIIEENFKVDEIYINLIGEIGYTITKAIISGNGQSSIRTEYQHALFYSNKISLAKPQFGEKELILNQREYLWLFEIPLIKYLPPTINKPQSYPHVRYYLQVVIDKPWYKSNIKQRKYITIYPRVNLLENPLCLLSNRFENENRKEIYLRGTIHKSGYVPNELIHIILDIENPQTVLIKHIELSMFQSYQIRQNSSEIILFKTILPNIINTKEQQIKETFAVLIPSRLIPPTYRFQGGIERFLSVNIYYFLRFEVKVSGLFTNFDVDIPIILGTEPIPDLNQQNITFNPLMVSYSLDDEQSIFNDDDDPPPTYESVVQNRE